MQSFYSSLSLPPKLHRSKTPEAPGMQMLMDLSTHDQFSLPSCSFCHMYFFCRILCVHFSNSLLPLPMDCRLPLDFLLMLLPHKVDYLIPSWASIIVAATTHIQLTAAALNQAVPLLCFLPNCATQ